MTCVFFACGEGSDVLPDNGGRLGIVTTIFPEYDWVMALLGDKAADADVAMLLDTGVDLHSYQPTAEDILKISTCDLFIYVGGESDDWVADALKEATNSDMIVLDLLDILGGRVKAEEMKEGMEQENEEEHDGEEEEEYDEHVWLSLRNAAVICEAVADALCTLDAENESVYKENLENYKAQLMELDERYSEAASNAKTKTLLFGDRFPFRYMTDDHGLDYYAAFAGCSAETGASFETIKILSDKIDELDLKYVMTIEGGDGKIAQTIISNTKSKDQTILALDSMQSVTRKDVEDGASYLAIMEKNLGVLKTALS